MNTSTARLLQIEEDHWLSGAVGFPVFRVDPICADEDLPTLHGSFADELNLHCQNQERALYCAKVDVTRVALLHALNDAGLAVVDVNVTLEISGGSPCSDFEQPDVMQILPARPEHAADVLRIAASSFRYSRMHLDPLIPSSIADRVRHEWIRSYLNGQRGDKLFVALREGKVLGFLAALLANPYRQRIGVLDLMGISVDTQRQGVGRGLVQHWMHAYRASCDLLRVGTQAANIPALRLYESCGMRTAHCAYVLHRHVDQR